MSLKEMPLAVAIGDAVGAGIEFQDRNWIRANVDFTKFINVRHTIVDGIDSEVKNPVLFTQNYHDWEYTDDAEMNAGTIKAILSGRPITPDLLVEFWTSEYLADMKRKGYGRNGHGSMAWVYSGDLSIKQLRDWQRQRTFPGNAPVIRGIPFGFLPEEQVNPCAAINADATHPNQRARAASILVARTARYIAFMNEDHKDIIPYCKEHIVEIDEEA